MDAVFAIKARGVVVELDRNFRQICLLAREMAVRTNTTVEVVKANHYDVEDFLSLMACIQADAQDPSLSRSTKA